jgi:hypothetical protein
MGELIHFVPKAELTAQKNRQQFIDQCKNQLTVFGENLEWDNWKWYKVAHFTKLGVHSTGSSEKDKLDDTFIEFAKAYFRYQQGHKPTGTKNELKALRVIESALLLNADKALVEEINVSVLDQSAQLARENYSQGAGYHCGREIERFAIFITEKQLVSQDLSNWCNPIPRKKDEIQTGLKAKERRNKKLPSEEGLNALAEIFANNPSEPRDLFTSSVFAMLMCSPSRITEILELPVDCEIEEMDSKGQLRYGWRFYSGKGFGADIKWIPSEMVVIAKEAIGRIKKLTSGSRKLAKWIENNPNEHSDEASILAVQPKGFPWFNQSKKIKYSDALFCMQQNTMGNRLGIKPMILWKPTNNFFNNDLSPRYALKGNHKSIFDRYGYKLDNGERIKLTSHQARHLLNTMAQRGGLSQLEIAKWSGRAEVDQNRVYNHMSEYEMVAKAEELDTSMTLFGSAGEVEKYIPITIQEFNTLEKGAVHVTEFGVCVHDYTMTPCEKYRDCLNCTEQVCIKGDNERLSRIKNRLTEVEKQYHTAQKAMDDGLAGADRWYEYHKNTFIRLKELVTILEDKNMPDGSRIKLRNDKAFSPLRRALESANKSPEIQQNNQSNILDDMTKMLGGGFG